MRLVEGRLRPWGPALASTAGSVVCDFVGLPRPGSGGYADARVRRRERRRQPFDPRRLDRGKGLAASDTLRGADLGGDRMTTPHRNADRAEA
jgi:hypothetical protein